mgnify:CR=1 FL=1
MRPLKISILIFLATIAAASAAESEGNVAPLFASNDLVEVTITAPLEEIMSVRSLEDEMPGTFAYRDAETGEDVSLDIGIRARGKFRRDKKTCQFAPLRLNFSKTKGTLLAKSNKLKLVTHCRNKSERYEQAVLKEFIAYRILNTLTDQSFRVRLLHVNYVESTTGESLATTYAFLIEHKNQLAKRIGMEVDESESTLASNLDGAHTNLVSVYQYLIGNTDFSPIKGVPGEACCHNYVLMKSGATQISVPYDFDVSGIVAPPHAKPNPRFGLASVRQRLYRGRCMNNDYLESTFQLFEDRKADIYGLVSGQQDLSDSEQKKTKKFIDSFYKIINSSGQTNRRIIKACLGGS